MASVEGSGMRLNAMLADLYFQVPLSYNLFISKPHNRYPSSAESFTQLSERTVLWRNCIRQGGNWRLEWPPGTAGQTVNLVARCPKLLNAAWMSDF